MKVDLTRERTETSITNLGRGEIFMHPDFEDTNEICMIINPQSIDDVSIVFPKGYIVAVSLVTGELYCFGPDSLVYVVEGEFRGKY